MLTTDQKIEFKRNGFLVLRDFLDEKLIKEASDVLEADCLPESVEELRYMERNPSEAPFDFEERFVKIFERNILIAVPTDEPFQTINAKIGEAATELTGEAIRETSQEITQFAIRFALDDEITDGDASQPSDLKTHIDGVRFTGYPVTIGAGLYLNRVQPRGGGFTVWPGSHWHVADYFRDHKPETAANGVPAPTEDGWHEETPLSDHFDPFEITGDPGTVILWHGHLEHSGGINLRPNRTRKAVFSRFKFPDESTLESHLSDPFAEWTIADSPPKYEPNEGK